MATKLLKKRKTKKLEHKKKTMNPPQPVKYWADIETFGQIQGFQVVIVAFVGLKFTSNLFSGKEGWSTERQPNFLKRLKVSKWLLRFLLDWNLLQIYLVEKRRIGPKNFPVMKTKNINCIKKNPQNKIIVPSCDINKRKWGLNCENFSQN